MLAAREDPNEEMSPKAKVTYDEDKFQVKKWTKILTLLLNDVLL
jgi:hypothetical protein